MSQSFSPLLGEQSLILKWQDEKVADITSNYELENINGGLNSVTKAIFGNKKSWSRAEFEDFLSDRIVSKDRRDIRTILARLNLPEYNVFDIAIKTRAFNFSDGFWISATDSESYTDTLHSIFNMTFGTGKDAAGDIITSPSGQNVKTYITMPDGSFGIAKERLNRGSLDAENEVVVYRLGTLLGVRCCYSEMIDDNRVFSKYMYNVRSEYLVHMRRILTAPLDVVNYEDDIQNQLAPYADDVRRMILLDFITNQTDRHLSNWGLLFDLKNEPTFYHLYDNGRSLFYQHSLKDLEIMQGNPKQQVETIGLVGDYLEAVELVAKDKPICSLIHLDVTKEQFKNCFRGLRRYEEEPERIEYLATWFEFAMKHLRELDKS